jgi:glycine/D-amino acid oxidase-like deaminating enzyme
MAAVVVVGAGIVGASVAYHLARLGVPVTVLEQGTEPATGVTGGSFAWVGGAGGDWPGGARELREHVLADYRRLEGELSTPRR